MTAFTELVQSHNSRRRRAKHSTFPSSYDVNIFCSRNSLGVLGSQVTLGRHFSHSLGGQCLKEEVPISHLNDSCVAVVQGRVCKYLEWGFLGRSHVWNGAHRNVFSCCSRFQSHFCDC